MALIKIIELLVKSHKSWEVATEKAVKRASETLRNIRSIWVRNLSDLVQKGKIISWRLNYKISFERDENN
jgi:flavin-binding protein dodecin